MLLPYRCDAPIHFQPYATLALIFANILVMVCLWTGFLSAQAFEYHWVLWHDEDGRWYQIFTSAFAHADAFHLVGNMVFLWVFGLIVEGKVGWRQFLGIYAAVAFIPSVLECMLLDQGGSLGASTAIYGLMVIAALWAPRNEVDTVFWYGFWFTHFTPTVFALVGFFVAWDLLGAWLVGFALSTPLLHVLGALIGLPVGLMMLHKNWVDCEGWDLLTIRKNGRPQSRRFGESSSDASTQAEALAAQCAAERQTAARLVDDYLRDQDTSAAVLVIDQIRGRDPSFTVNEKQARQLLTGLWQQRSWSDIERLADWVTSQHPALNPPADLMRAAIAIRHHERPTQGISILRRIDLDGLTESQRKRHEALRQKAEAMQAEGVLEIVE